jgi:hypothetical protein
MAGRDRRFGRVPRGVVSLDVVRPKYAKMSNLGEQWQTTTRPLLAATHKYYARRAGQQPAKLDGSAYFRAANHHTSSNISSGTLGLLRVLRVAIRTPGARALPHRH